MSNVTWPALHGLSWALKKTATFSNAVQRGTVPGIETRISFGPDPIFLFELAYEILYAAMKGDTLAQLEGFYLARNGGYDSFLIDAGAITKNPAESSIANQPLTIDINGCAPLIRTKTGGYNEAIYELAVDGFGEAIPPVIKQGSTTLVLGTDFEVYTSQQVLTGVLNANGISYSGIVIKFIASPAITTGVTASFAWMYRMRFMNQADGASGTSQSATDSQDFDMFHYLLWHCQTIQLIGCRS
jgi:hypothetical protein